MVKTPGAMRMALLRGARATAALCACGRVPRPHRRTCEACAARAAARDEARRAAGFKRVWVPVDLRKARP